jgi:hypothetical protein
MPRVDARGARGGGKGSADIEKHTANHFTGHVATLFVYNVSGKQILFELAKLLQPSTETSLYNAIFRWYNIRPEECGSHQEIRGTVKLRV